MEAAIKGVIRGHQTQCCTCPMEAIKGVIRGHQTQCCTCPMEAIKGVIRRHQTQCCTCPMEVHATQIFTRSIIVMASMSVSVATVAIGAATSQKETKLINTRRRGWPIGTSTVPQI